VQAAASSQVSALRAILSQRCPQCRQGRVFRRGLEMFTYCPICKLHFQREQGYFLGAMYFSYFLSIPFIVTFFLLVRHFTRLAPALAVGLCALFYLPLVPVVVRYSRVLWIWWDRTVDPE
jgi:uncharacterized protein (DUF983 family)